MKVVILHIITAPMKKDGTDWIFLNLSSSKMPYKSHHFNFKSSALSHPLKSSWYTLMKIVIRDEIFGTEVAKNDGGIPYKFNILS